MSKKTTNKLPPQPTTTREAEIQVMDVLDMLKRIDSARLRGDFELGPLGKPALTEALRAVYSLSVAMEKDRG
jgi:hypothetical protein